MTPFWNVIGTCCPKKLVLSIFSDFPQNYINKLYKLATYIFIRKLYCSLDFRKRFTFNNYCYYVIGNGLIGEQN